MIIRSGVGGGYDLYARVLGAHIGKHIPGNPTVIPINMPGGGGIKAANYVAVVAPKDGTILTMVSQGLAVDQALGINNGLEADLRDFHWVGNMSSHNQVTVVWHTSKTQTFDDALKRETIIGCTGAGSISRRCRRSTTTCSAPSSSSWSAIPTAPTSIWRWSAGRWKPAPPIPGSVTRQPRRIWSRRR